MNKNSLQIKPSYPQGRASKKSRIEGPSISNDTWDHSNSNLIKNSFNLWSENSSSSKIYQLHSFHMHQNKKTGAIYQTTILFLSSPLNLHSRSFLTETGNTYFKLKTTKRKVQSTLVLSQWTKIWLVDSSSSLQRLHLLTMDHPSFINISTVTIVLQTVSHAKEKKNTFSREPRILKSLWLGILYYPKHLRIYSILDTKISPPILFLK